jgi:3-phenylpropionate/trans-cinnamate dioxygenase ferredoxin reductase subunit
MRIVKLSQSGAKRVVVVGAGQAAAQLVQSLRQGGFGGEIIIIGDEPVLPYQRPPLSKAYMKGELDAERLFFRPAAWYEDNQIALKLGITVAALDRARQHVIFEDGGSAGYDFLILATGSRPRRLTLPGAELTGVHDLRTLADVERIRPQLVAGRRIAIIGAGYIGLEAAAVARQLGLAVTVVELADRVLARVTSPVISNFFAAEHEAQGVKILTGISTSHIEGKDGRVSAVVLADGRSLEADLVLAGIGVVPNEELAKSAGIACANGILVDRDSRTNDPRIFAAGDCSNRPLVHYARAGRLESVHNAIEQAKMAAAAILGHGRPAEDCPWFWSDQYDLKLQIAGLSQGHDEVVLRGEPDTRQFAVFYLRGRQLLAVDAVNSPAEFLAGKKLIISGAELAPEHLGDKSISMKDIAAGVAA